MDFVFTQEQEAFRSEVKEFFRATKEEWKMGWLSLSWPKEYGGRNSLIFQNIFSSSCLTCPSSLDILCEFAGEVNLNMDFDSA